MIRPVHNTAKYVPPPNPSGFTAPLWDGVCVASGNSLVTILEEEEEKNPKLLLIITPSKILSMAEKYRYTKETKHTEEISICFKVVSRDMLSSERKLDYDLQLSNQILTLQTSKAKLEHAIATSDTTLALKITADAMKSALENLHGVPQLMTQMEGQRQKLEHVVEALYLDDSLEEELNRLMEEMTEPPEVQAQAETMNLKIENSEAKTQASLSRLQDKNSLKLKKRVISQAKQLTDELLIFHSDTTVARMLVGNKCDLENIRSVSVEEGKDLAEAQGLFFVETSALDSTNVRIAFEKVILDIYNNVSRKQLNSDTYKDKLTVSRVSLVKDDDNTDSKQSSGFSCCSS
ncbi:unnamed protein product [Brassica oleracea var. botrytis]